MDRKVAPNDDGFIRLLFERVSTITQNFPRKETDYLNHLYCLFSRTLLGRPPAPHSKQPLNFARGNNHSCCFELVAGSKYILRQEVCDSEACCLLSRFLIKTEDRPMRDESKSTSESKQNYRGNWDGKKKRERETCRFSQLSRKENCNKENDFRLETIC